MELLRDPEFWVGIGTLIFLAIIVWKRVPALIASSLDARAAAIAKELEDARRLRAEAERFGAEARAAITAQITRRGKQAEEKIAQAEAQAVADVRAIAADAAITAAEKLIAARLDDTRAAELVKRALGEIPSKLN